MINLELLKETLIQQGADEETLWLLDQTLRNVMHSELSFRNRNDIEIYLESLLKGWNSETSGYNMIPSDKKGPCRKLCVGIASNSFDGKRVGLNTGFKGLMLNLTAYWFGCLKTNQTTIIYTNDWNTKKFRELYKDIIDNYTQTHNKKVFIIELDPAGCFVRYPF